MGKVINLQDTFLNHIRKEKIVVTVYLTNGFQIRGIIKGFDSFIIVIDSDGKQQLVYKHAVSTIAPTKPINLNIEKISDEQEQ